MKIYKVIKYTQLEGSQGFEYTASFADAKSTAAKFRRDFKEQEPQPEIVWIEVEPTLKGIIKALNDNGGHPDNG